MEERKLQVLRVKKTMKPIARAAAHTKPAKRKAKMARNNSRKTQLMERIAAKRGKIFIDVEAFRDFINSKETREIVGIPPAESAAGKNGKFKAGG